MWYISQTSPVTKGRNVVRLYFYQLRPCPSTEALQYNIEYHKSKVRHFRLTVYILPVYVYVLCTRCTYDVHNGKWY